MAIGYREDPTTSNFLKSKGGHIRHIVTYLNNLLALSTTNILLKGLDRLPNFVAQVPLEASRSEWDMFPAPANLIGLSFPRLLWKLLRSRARNACVNTCQDTFYRDILPLQWRLLMFHRCFRKTIGRCIQKVIQNVGLDTLCTSLSQVPKEG